MILKTKIISEWVLKIRKMWWTENLPVNYKLQRKTYNFIVEECKSRKSRNTWSNRQIWPWSIEWSRTKANKSLPREHTGHSKYPLPTTQEMTLHTGMDITRESLKSDWLCCLQPKMEEKHYTVRKNKTWSWLWLRSWAPYCKIKAYIKESRENH